MDVTVVENVINVTFQDVDSGTGNLVTLTAEIAAIPTDFVDYMDAEKATIAGYRDEVEADRVEVNQRADDAAASATAAASSATSASNSEDLAGTHATNAGTSADEASTSAGAALTSEQKAKSWAEGTEDTEVEPGQYSALHHAAKAADSEVTAENSAAAALVSEGNAENSATAAATSETNADSSATAAATSESNAATSEANAATSEQNAADSAAAAATSEANTASAIDDHEALADPHPQYEKKRQDNLTATTNPTATDDSSAGYEVLSRWVNTATGELWLCVNASVGAANWQQATLTLDELGSAALNDTADFEPAGSTSTHEAAADPHSQYTTDAEATAIAVSQSITFSIALG